MGSLLGSENDLTLAFTGTAEVHAANSRALLKDLISAHKKQNPNGKVRFIFPLDHFSSTMDDLADFALTSGYDLELIGRHEDLKQFAQLKQSSARYCEVKYPTRQMIQRILPDYGNPRLILIADPNEDDDAYNAVGWASDANIPVRSLLKGLDTVMFSDSSEDEQEEAVPRDEEWDEDEADEAGLHVVDDDEDEYGDEEEEESEEDESEEDEESEEEEEGEEEEYEDEEEDEEETEEESEEDEDEESDESDDEEYDEEESEDEDEESEDEDDEETEDDVEDEEDLEDDDVEDEEEEVAPQKYTEKSLLSLADKDYEQFKKIAIKHGAKPGRGISKANLVQQILEATSGKSSRTRSTAAAKKTTTARRPAAAKKAPAKRRATTAKAPAKKTASRGRPAGTTKRTGTARKSSTTRRTAPVRASAAAASTNGQVSKAVLRSFIKVAQSALEVAEQLI